MGTPPTDIPCIKKTNMANLKRIIPNNLKILLLKSSGTTPPLSSLPEIKALHIYIHVDRFKGHSIQCMLFSLTG
jgi:hypothetical protein